MRWGKELSAALLLAAAPALADTATPGMPIDLGGLDQVSQEVQGQKRFTCTALELKLFSADPRFAYQDFVFSIISPMARLAIKMIETPDATLYFHLYDVGGKFIKEYRGGDDQEIGDSLPNGRYRLRLLGTTDRTNPDGSRRAQITFTAFPSALDRQEQTEPTNLGQLNERKIVTGALGYRSKRTFPYILQSGKAPCPAEGAAPSDNADIFELSSSPRNVSVGLTTSNLMNWPTAVPLHLSWRKSPGDVWQTFTGNFRHPGGMVQIQVGYGGNSIVLGDYHAEYTLTIDRIP